MLVSSVVGLGQKLNTHNFLSCQLDNDSNAKIAKSIG